MGSIVLRLLFALLLLGTTEALAQGRQIIGVATVVDGDTIEIHGERIRLFGIDAPESRQECRQADGRLWRCGQKAALALQDYIGRRPISCEQRDVDRYRRIVGRCLLTNADINAWLVGQGWAVAYTKYSRDYVREEIEARDARRGIWSGDFVMPWEWRRGERPVWTAQ
jgi:endonuclease YncB( thermonuclease family)